MTLCREWTLVNYEPEIRRARPLKCRSWGCELCRPDRKAQLFAQAVAGNPNRFLTLTVNPAVGRSPAERLRLLTNAWRILVKRIRREHGPNAVEYLAIVEETKKGEPHLHILLRSRYLAHSYISAAMAELIQAPIVDIRKIRKAREVVAYVAKYITKAPAQFDRSKRYWKSQNWEPRADYKQDEAGPILAPWQVEKEPLIKILSIWASEGFVSRRDARDAIIAFHGRTNW